MGGLGEKLGASLGSELTQALRAIADSLSQRVTIVDIDLTLGSSPIKGTIKVRQEEPPRG